MSPSDRPIVVIGISGASGAAIGIRVLELLRDSDRYDVHLAITEAGALTIRQETDRSRRDVEGLADVVHKNSHVGASIASGSTSVAAMIIAPCSVRTLSAVAHGITDDLLTRAADVCLKERRPLVMLFRESPIHLGHLNSMRMVSRAGAIVAPPVPAFYQRPQTVDAIIDDIARRAIGSAGLLGAPRRPWTGIPAADATPSDPAPQTALRRAQ